MELPKLTDDDLHDLQYAFEEKDDITYCETWETQQDQIKAEYPELIVAVNNLDIAKRTLAAIVKNLR